ncbi:hypothetical protein [Calidifontibacillus oryziterrae]|uniref:hypothetical protein n=1 Tax=Calidifontibacillus oryziterrae TaxID=1191699 RepID=UPI0012B636DC|nr:hypothetical protein [Calidifontibacillus oryziterrae]
MANRFGKRMGDSLFVKMSLNLRELAQLAGVKSTELAEVINDLEEKRILKMMGNSFEIDLQKLR